MPTTSTGDMDQLASAIGAWEGGDRAVPATSGGGGGGSTETGGAGAAPAGAATGGESGSGGGDYETSPQVLEVLQDVPGAIAPSQSGSTGLDAPVPGAEALALSALLERVTQVNPGRIFEVPANVQRMIESMGTGWVRRFDAILKALGFEALGDIGMMGWNVDYRAPDTFNFGAEFQALLSEGMAHQERLAMELLLGSLLGEASQVPLIYPYPEDAKTQAWSLPGGGTLELPSLEVAPQTEAANTGE